MAPPLGAPLRFATSMRPHATPAPHLPRLCHALQSAATWLPYLAQPQSLERIVFIISNTLGEALLQRSMELAAAIAQAAPELAPPLLNEGLLGALQAIMQAAVRQLAGSCVALPADGAPAGVGGDWSDDSGGWSDDEGKELRGSAGAQPCSEAVVIAGLCCLERLGSSDDARQALTNPSQGHLSVLLVQLLGCEAAAVLEQLLLVLVVLHASCVPLLAAEPQRLQRVAQALNFIDVGANEDAVDAVWYLAHAGACQLLSLNNAHAGGSTPEAASVADALQGVVCALQSAPVPDSSLMYATAFCRRVLGACASQLQASPGSEGAPGSGAAWEAIQAAVSALADQRGLL